MLAPAASSSGHARGFVLKSRPPLRPADTPAASSRGHARSFVLRTRPQLRPEDTPAASSRRHARSFVVGSVPVRGTCHTGNGTVPAKGAADVGGARMTGTPPRPLPPSRGYRPVGVRVTAPVSEQPRRWGYASQHRPRHASASKRAGGCPRHSTGHGTRQRASAHGLVPALLTTRLAPRYSPSPHSTSPKSSPHTPTSASTRPSRTAASSTAWSASVRSAYATAKAAMASSSSSVLPQ